MSDHVVPFLLFDGRAEEAMRFYVSLFPDSEVIEIARYGKGADGAEGTGFEVARVDGQQEDREKVHRKKEHRKEELAWSLIPWRWKQARRRIARWSEEILICQEVPPRREESSTSRRTKNKLFTQRWSTKELFTRTSVEIQSRPTLTSVPGTALYWFPRSTAA